MPLVAPARRSRVVLAVAACALAVLAPLSGTPALGQGAGARVHHGTAVTAHRAGDHLIEGLVFAASLRKRSGCDLAAVAADHTALAEVPGCQALDDVKVQARDADTGVKVASALTYASDRADGPQHGYYYLEVPAGTFTVTFQKKGMRTTRTTVVVPDSGRGARAWAGLRYRDLRTSLTFARGNPTKVAACRAPRFLVGLVYRPALPRGASAYPRVPTGKAVVSVDGKKVFSGTVKEKWKGSIALTLSTSVLRAGRTQKLTMDYQGISKVAQGQPRVLGSSATHRFRTTGC